MSKKFITTGKMKKSKIIDHICAFIMALSIMWAGLMISLSFNSSNLSYFENYQKDNNILEAMGINQDKLDEINKDLISYLKEGREELLTSHFNQREVAHMRDVFKLFRLARISMYLTIGIIIFLLIYAACRKRLRDLMRLGFRYILLILLALALFVFIISRNFDESFIAFHHIFFDNDLWLLNPDTDMMIRMLPQTFFSGMAFNIVRDFVVALLLIIIFMFLIGRKRGENDTVHRE